MVVGERLTYLDLFCLRVFLGAQIGNWIVHGLLWAIHHLRG